MKSLHDMSFSEDSVERIVNILPVDRIVPGRRIVIETDIFDDGALDNVAVGVAPNPDTKLSVAIPTLEWDKCIVLPLIKRGL